MWRILSKSILLLGVAVLICCILYPLALWVVGQTLFPFQANGSILNGPDGKPVGSRLLAQPFTRDEYFQPRPSAASYDASASAASSLAASNYALRDRVGRTLGPVVTYRGGARAGQPVGPDVEKWFQQDSYQGQPHLVAQWAEAHSSLAQAWAKADPANGAYIDDWARNHPEAVARFIQDNPSTPKPQPEDLAVVFFQDFSEKNPGKFPSLVTHKGADGNEVKVMEPAGEGSDIRSTFFLMWREEHPQADLQDVPGDLVTASASGLDPHITLKNAEFQLARVASRWAANLRRQPDEVKQEIERILQKNAAAPWFGLAGEKLVNVLEVNLELRRRYGPPPS